MPQYKHNLIIVTGRRYRPNIKGELLSFLHSHVCISFSHPLYLSRCVGCVLTPPPSFFASDFYEAIQYFSNARLFTQSIKDQVFISFICVSIHFSHGKAFFSILGQLGLLVCIDIRALVYRRVYIVINVLALLIMRVLVFVCNSET